MKKRRSVKILICFFAFLFLLPQVRAEAIPQEKALIAQIIDAYGGKKKLSEVVSISAEGRITKRFPEDKGTYYRYMKRPGKLLVDIKYSESSEKRILNGNHGYRGTNGKVEAVKGPPYDAMVYQYDQLDLPFGFLDRSLSVAALHKDKLNGADVDVLELKDREGYEIEIYVGARDHLVLKATGYFKIGRNETSLSAEFSDFRKVDGILLPFRITNYARDFKISETEITKYMINPDIPGSVFNPSH
jgi:outer membrane lipoprotein-sorting protein